jgi:hypothetical protein
LVVFERSSTQEFDAVDLYVMNRDGSGIRLLVEDGRLPSWSRGVVEVGREDVRPAAEWQVYFGGVADFVDWARQLWEMVIDPAVR